ncbi:hypothetical protein ADK53_03585 [Streptomyces sp. WM6373]|uniref:hypothetical protein n=1 Tax=Streptomyces TaxID=1883 RepID=UPI0006ADCA46|nr:MULTISPECIES: hypothetical protein [unclassified Streptomyces]KOU44230.1 hypothetical protein ADK53_03585 [Streptomyces sp. WM6373]KOU65152.1 hypothetical protein ADK96_18295 [Streptomyces sp. IGB124]KOU85753.1 hypothetical protein ADK93_21470 [Streptomyces sp. XY58]KOU86139.1 hypothetical protein ADK61_05395 [Streptomyces sp. XY66]KOV05244.1 hypothetical protein ADK89_20145 [Streptomyces sp. XY37]
MSQNFTPPAPDSYSPVAAPAPTRGGNIGLGIVAAVVAAIVTGGVYGAIIGASGYQIGYAAVAVGAVVGLAAGKVGGSNPVLPLLSVVLSLAAVFGGQLFGIAWILADELGTTVPDVLSIGVPELVEAWQEVSSPMTFLFLAIGGYAAFQSARKAGH